MYVRTWSCIHTNKQIRINRNRQMTHNHSLTRCRYAKVAKKALEEAEKAKVSTEFPPGTPPANFVPKIVQEQLPIALKALRIAGEERFILLHIMTMTLAS